MKKQDAATSSLFLRRAMTEEQQLEKDLEQFYKKINLLKLEETRVPEEESKVQPQVAPNQVKHKEAEQSSQAQLEFAQQEARK